jgi:hypothetical protein
LSIPRRIWTKDQTAEIVDRMTEAHRVPGSTARLRPLQAIALAEIAMFGGAHIGIPVGGGKTLTQLLAPKMLKKVQRPLFLNPAHLIEKTEREAAEYRRDWVLPAFYRIESYQTLSRVSKADFLDQYMPDLIVCDEAQFVKTPGAGVTKRVFRYLKANPGCVVVFMTGTPFGVSLRDFAHQMKAALGDGSPVPHTYLDLDEWCRALDADTPEQKALGFGALHALDPVDPVKGFQQRLYTCPGVILSQDPPLDIPIHIEAHEAPQDEAIEEAIKRLRQDWITPDGIECRDGVEVWRHAREIATGFYSVWTPRPPVEWAAPRSAWARECREILSSNRRDLDTEEQLIRHMQAEPGHYPEALATYLAWKEVEPTFIPNPVPYWISDKVIDWIVKWSKKSPGLIWTDRPAVGARLAARGLCYYGLDGVDAKTGKRTEEHDPSVSCVLGRKSNDSGRNLQAWRRNLVIDIPSRGTDWEQLIGRTHRPGQRAERIDVSLLFGCLEDVEAFWKAHGRALRAQEITGQAQKLCQADLSCVTEVTELDSREWRWKKTKPPKDSVASDNVQKALARLMMQ